MHKIDLITLEQLFEKSADVRFQTYEFQSSNVILITCEAMTDKYLLNEVIVPRLQALCDNKELPLDPLKIPKQLYLPDLQEVTTLNDAVTNVYGGFVLIYIEEQKLLLSSNIESKPNRSPEETSLEVLIKGPRDNFIEDLAVNIALIRKRVPTESLAVEKLTIGVRSKTKVAILYFQDIANLDTLKELKQQLLEINTDVVLSGELLMERLNKYSYFIPVNDTTGRPDFALQSLITGRFIVLVDGVAYAIITPTNLLMLLKSGEDNDYPMIISSIERLLRLGSVLVALLLPAFWLALTTFHQEQLPFQLLATVVQSNTGLPLPSSVEMLIMLLMFELFREAGLRLPSILGGSISVVGGLIIGDAAIRAGVTSPAMIVVIAISTIATFTLVNQSLVTSIGLMRVTLILITALLGLFGFFLSIYIVLIYLSNIRVYGVPYLNVGADLSWKNISKSLFRLPPDAIKERPAMLKPQDKTKEGKK
ncbi:spore germination protein [Solibacillus sp. R5-41]|uniref:spore germination protein n=1 Tax=Solibacillus sp. R5-41 TaxID=2048654 RepID=UPI000C12983E|nr:spore germination protein [Solibacillus sp. R5-41]ATP41600.1 spore germination protein [Solibacillus sp. R5-41]